MALCSCSSPERNWKRDEGHRKNILEPHCPSLCRTPQQLPAPWPRGAGSGGRECPQEAEDEVIVLFPLMMMSVSVMGSLQQTRDILMAHSLNLETGRRVLKGPVNSGRVGLHSDHHQHQAERWHAVLRAAVPSFRPQTLTCAGRHFIHP